MTLIVSVIDFPALPAAIVGGYDIEPGATSNSPATIEYQSSDTSIATIVAGRIRLVSAGTVTITASQAITTGYTQPTSVTQSLTVNRNSMANEINGSQVGLFVNTNFSVPAWKEVICAENTGIDGSADVSTKKTKCGTVKSLGPVNWTISGTGTHSTAPGADQISADDLIDLLQAGTKCQVKVAHDTNTALVYRVGTAYLSKYAEKENVGDSLNFDFTFDVVGELDITP